VRLVIQVEAVGDQFLDIDFRRTLESPVASPLVPTPLFAIAPWRSAASALLTPSTTASASTFAILPRRPVLYLRPGFLFLFRVWHVQQNPCCIT
jgi:hypothetical protein